MIFNISETNESGGGGGSTSGYFIHNNDSTYISIDKSVADEGDTVTITVVGLASTGAIKVRKIAGYPSETYGYTLYQMSPKLFNAGKISYEIGDTWQFTMPAYDVTVYVGEG